MTTSHQFVPLISSLSDNAPGYNDSGEIGATSGPICWKCAGSGLKKTGLGPCVVCQGTKRLPTKVKCHIPPSVATDMESEGCLANGEQLCELVGGWKIFQNRGGHRWTTDDIVTAWVAIRSKYRINSFLQAKGRMDPIAHPTNYLDLGCGNGSILMMVARNLKETTNCIGVEARREAVNLSRRSVQYNLSNAPFTGHIDSSINIVHSDFRGIFSRAATVDPETNLLLPQQRTFSLVTGSPPYFRVEFTIDSSHQVQKAVIRQGGMPTCKESAPARCEFRGGIESYCQAAMMALSDNGVFVVCENYANHNRVLKAATEADLFIFCIHRVVGRVGKPVLFAVYSMIRNCIRDEIVRPTVSENEQSLCCGDSLASHSDLCEFSYDTFLVTREYEDIVVRDVDGAWTSQYAQLLSEMQYPVRSLHPSGLY